MVKTRQKKRANQDGEPDQQNGKAKEEKEQMAPAQKVPTQPQSSMIKKEKKEKPAKKNISRKQSKEAEKSPDIRQYFKSQKKPMNLLRYRFAHYQPQAIEAMSLTADKSLLAVARSNNAIELWHTDTFS